MAIVYSPRFSVWLRKAFGLRSPFALELGDQLSPMVSVLDPARADQGFHRGETRWAVGADVGGVVGQFSHLILKNPSDSGRLVIVERVVLFIPGGALVQVGWHPGTGANPPAAGTFRSMDGRQGNVVPASKLFAGSAAANILAEIARPFQNVTGTQAAVFTTEPGESWVLPPSDVAGLVIEPVSTNVAIRGVFHWIERELGDEGP